MIPFPFFPVMVRWPGAFAHSIGQPLRWGPLRVSLQHYEPRSELSWPTAFHTSYGGDRSTSNFIMTPIYRCSVLNTPRRHWAVQQVNAGRKSGTLLAP